jgi:hypothetical protein
MLKVTPRGHLGHAHRLGATVAFDGDTPDDLRTALDFGYRLYHIGVNGGLWTHNRQVPGSSLGRPTIFTKIFEQLLCS